MSSCVLLKVHVHLQHGHYIFFAATCAVSLTSVPSIRAIDGYLSSLGLYIMVLTMLGSSFANMTTQLLVTQGIFYAIGSSFAHAPLIYGCLIWFSGAPALFGGLSMLLKPLKWP